MEDAQLPMWLILVPTYVAIARFRGSSWQRIVLTPTVMVLVAFVEFGLPPMWHIDGVRRASVIIGAGSIAACGVLLLRRRLPPLTHDDPKAVASSRA